MDFFDYKAFFRDKSTYYYICVIEAGGLLFKRDSAQTQTKFCCSTTVGMGEGRMGMLLPENMPVN